MAAGSAARNASTSASVEVWPSVSRSAPRASLLGDAHGEQHVAGLRHAGLAGRAGGALDAGGVEQVEQRVALAARARAGGRCPGAGVCRRRPATRPSTVMSWPRPSPPRISLSRKATRRVASARATADGLVDGDGERADGRDVEGAAADLRAPDPRRELCGHERRVATDEQRADARAGRRPCGRSPSSGRRRTRRSRRAGGRRPARRRCANGTPNSCATAATSACRCWARRDLAGCSWTETQGHGERVGLPLDGCACAPRLATP